MATAVAVAAAVVQYAVPSVVPVLERDPRGLTLGQCWRAVTPLLVQTLGAHQVLANLITLAAVGLVAERLLGPRRWLAVFAAGTAGGQVAAFWGSEPGGGDSIAVCGLAGGALLALLLLPRPVPRLSTYVLVGYVVTLTGWELRGVPGAALAVLLAAAGLSAARGLGGDLERVGLLGAAAGTAVLLAAGDLHGWSLASGLGAALALRSAFGPGPAGAAAARTARSLAG